MTATSQVLFENQEGYKKLFDNAHDLIHFAKPDSSLIYVNRSWSNTLGYSPEEIVGKSIYSFIDIPDKDRFIHYRDKVINETATDEKIVISLKTKTGKLVKIEGFILVEFKDNIADYTTGIFRDVTVKLENETKLKESNEQLKQSEFDLQQLLYYAPDAIIVIDQYGNIQFWNPKAETLFGWTAAEVTGQSLTYTIVPPQHREAHDNGMKRYLTTGIVSVLNKTIEITALNKSGKEFYVSLTISTTRQKGNVAFIAFIRDITLQKNNELELEKSRKELEVSNHELEQFAHVVSHDMKEPIRKIKMFIERTIFEFENVLPDNAKMYFEKIQNGANRLTNMVDGVLNYSTITSTDEPFEEIDLNKILKSIEEDLEILISQKNAEISFGSCPPFEGVPFLIRQLFYNLINNSLKFSKKDIPPVINITAGLIAQNNIADVNAALGGPFVQISLKDNGIGFHQEYAEKIFATFTRLNSKDKYEGTGLGLALCKNIVTRHHGFITAESEKDAGAVFKIILPQKQAR